MKIDINWLIILEIKKKIEVVISLCINGYLDVWYD